MQFNQKLHSSKLYNGFQFTVSALAVFSGSTYNSMKKHQETLTCFVAGTMILTASGLVAIENIKAGDKVISTDPETMETSPKTVLETYIREVTTLVHLTVNGEEIVTTVDHPFYVKDKGFINAGELKINDELLDSNGNILLIENFAIELTEKPVTVYYFQVEDFHTYLVGGFRILVHNADYKITLSREKYPESAKHIEDAIKNGQPRKLTINGSGAKSNIKASLKAISKVSGKDLDEYPFAMCKEGGKGTHVRAIKRSDNRGSGSFIGHKLRGLPDGATFEIIIVD